MTTADTEFARDARETAESDREIQQRIDKADKKSKPESKKAPQTGQRDYPSAPLPRQHQAKPGIEAKLDPRPMYEAPGYKGSDKLLDMAAIITGGNSGIGRGVAVLFAREGADVAIVYLEESEDAEETKAAVENEGRRCLLIPGDVTDPQFCEHAVARTVKEFGKLDILVNNAAFQEHVTKFEDLTEAHFDRTIKTNLYGYFHMAKAAVPHIGEKGSIINTGSVTGLMGSKELLDYSMTKGGIHAFTRALAASLLERGIRVNAVAPGPVWTPLNPADKAAPDVAKFGADVPMKRPAQPEEIAPAYVFLAAPSCSSYITGEILPDNRRLLMALLNLEPGPDATSIAELRKEAAACRRCPLYKIATQTVFGEGPEHAKMMLVGEQPGDQEDIAGRPFVGPAGKILDRAMAEAGIDRKKAYVTNAVKHFKNEPRGKKRLHKRPNAYEISRCKWWLNGELKIVNPKLVVALGATAASSLAGRAVAIGRERDKPVTFADGHAGFVTTHPSAILRMRGEDERREGIAMLVRDLKDATRLL